MRSKVDLPQPDGPTNTTNSFGSTSRSTPLMTSVPLKDFCRFDSVSSLKRCSKSALTTVVLRDRASSFDRLRMRSSERISADLR